MIFVLSRTLWLHYKLRRELAVHTIKVTFDFRRTLANNFHILSTLFGFGSFLNWSIFPFGTYNNFHIAFAFHSRALTRACAHSDTGILCVFVPHKVRQTKIQIVRAPVQSQGVLVNRMCMSELQYGRSVYCTSAYLSTDASELRFYLLQNTIGCGRLTQYLRNLT